MNRGLVQWCSSVNCWEIPSCVAIYSAAAVACLFIFHQLHDWLLLVKVILPDCSDIISTDQWLYFVLPHYSSSLKQCLKQCLAADLGKGVAFKLRLATRRGKHMILPPTKMPFLWKGGIRQQARQTNSLQTVGHIENAASSTVIIEIIRAPWWW